MFKRAWKIVKEYWDLQLCLLALFLFALWFWMVLFWPTKAATSHIERGCAPAPAALQVPHWVEEDVCTGKPVYKATFAARDSEGNHYALVALFRSEELGEGGRIGTLVFLLNENGTQYVLLSAYYSATGRNYERDGKGERL